MEKTSPVLYQPPTRPHHYLHTDLFKSEHTPTGPTPSVSEEHPQVNESTKGQQVKMSLGSEGHRSPDTWSKPQEPQHEDSLNAGMMHG